MKDCGIAVLCIGKDLSDRLAGTHLIACLHIDLAQVAIYRQIVTWRTMTELLYPGTTKHTRHLTIEHGAGIRTRSGLDVYTAVIRTDILQFLVLLFAEGSDNRMAAGHRIRQTPLLLAKSSDKRFSAFVMA